MVDDTLRRRRFAQLVGAAGIAGVAGCQDDPADDESGAGPEGDSGESPSGDSSAEDGESDAPAEDGGDPDEAPSDNPAETNDTGEQPGGEEGASELTVLVLRGGDPVEGAVVVVQPQETQDEAEEPLESETDGEGIATFELNDGSYLVRAESEGDQAEQDVTIEGADTEVPLELGEEGSEAVDDGSNEGRTGSLLAVLSG